VWGGTPPIHRWQGTVRRLGMRWDRPGFRRVTSGRHLAANQPERSGNFSKSSLLGITDLDAAKAK
jgi:hypothetical protein